MNRTPEDWQAALDLDELPDTGWLESLAALEGRETIEGGGLETQGLIVPALTPDEIEAALVPGGRGEEP